MQRQKTSSHTKALRCLAFRVIPIEAAFLVAEMKIGRTKHFRSLGDVASTAEHILTATLA